MSQHASSAVPRAVRRGGSAGVHDAVTAGSRHGDTRCPLTPAWGETAWREGVVLSCTREAIPMVIEGLRRGASASPAVLMVQAGAVVVGGLDLGFVGVFAQDSGATQRVHSLCPLVRLCAGPSRPTGPGWTACPVRVVEATAGREPVRTGGTAVTTAPVDAYDGDTGSFQPMVLVRSGPEANPRLRSLAESAAGLCVGARTFAILPCTHERGGGTGLGHGMSPTRTCCTVCRLGAHGASRPTP